MFLIPRLMNRLPEAHIAIQDILIYVTMVLQLIGVGIASASWLFLLFVIIFFILLSISVIAEERGCLEEYGDSYREYMNRTPRWIGIPKFGEE